MIYTSGTTGLPKAVMVEHGGLAAVLAAVVDRFGVRRPATGCRIWRASPSTSRCSSCSRPCSAAAPARSSSRRRSWSPRRSSPPWSGRPGFHAVPSLMRQVAASARAAGPERFAGLRTLFTGGDLVPPDLLAELGEVFPSAEVVVLYGPTEGTIVCTCHPVPPDARPERTLIGRPFANAEIRVIDRWGDAPLGVPGELWIGGPGVARGYFRRDELTAERFVERDGRRYYRTGDLVRHLADGTLEFLGRTDLQVKIRGFRVEPGEVEAALLAHPAVREAVVVARAEPQGASGWWPTGARPRAPRRRSSPAALSCGPACRSTWCRRLRASRRAAADGARQGGPQGLPAPADVAGGGGRRPPRDAHGRSWWPGSGARCSACRGSAGHDDFFQLGGDSLLTTQVATRLREALGVEVPVRTLFQAPILAELAAEVDAFLAEGDFGAVAPPILPVPREGDLPLSFAQERLWLVDRLTPGRTGLQHRPRPAPARRALGAGPGGGPRRDRRGGTRPCAPSSRAGGPAGAADRAAGAVAAAAGGPRGPAGGAPRGRGPALAGEEAARPFDLARGPVLRATLLRLGGGGALPAARRCTTSSPTAGRWACWSPRSRRSTAPRSRAARRRCRSCRCSTRTSPSGSGGGSPARPGRQLGYWRERLAGAPVLALPADRPRPARRRPGRRSSGSRCRRRTAGLAALARRRGATLFMALLAAFQALLGRYTGQDDVVVGSPVANRNRAEIEGLIGFFVNSLVMRADLGGDPAFGELLARAGEAALGGLRATRTSPSSGWSRSCGPERDLAPNPLFQVVCALQTRPLARDRAAGADARPRSTDDCTATVST